MTSSMNLDDYRHRALVGNTAQSVRKYLVEIESNRANMRARWIWELLQNALDASVQHLATSVECSKQDVVFQHNGREFEYDEVTHLIYHGSTKVENEDALGQYGSGFLTTHLLSPQIDVSGRLGDDQSFGFSIRREIASPETLIDSMDEAWDAFKQSLHESLNSDYYTTRFRYPLTDDAADVVDEGVALLKRCAPFVVVINDRFSRIDIKSLGETASFEVSKRTPIERDGLSCVTVVEAQNGHSIEHRYILAEGKKSSVAIPLSQSEDGRQYLSIPDAPKLFLGFPLVGTDEFSFPAIINSFRFTPTENRDGVYLWQGSNKANLENQSVVEEAFALLTELIDFATSSGWHSIHLMAYIPIIRPQGWLDEDKLQECLVEHLIEPIRRTPAVLCEFNTNALSPVDAILPIVEEHTAVESLWDLLSDVEEFRHRLPRRDEAIGWCNAVKSWANVKGCEPTDFPEVIDGRKLAEYIEEKSDCEFENLQNLLCDNVCAVNWLNSLLEFLLSNGFDGEVRNRSLVLDQGGYLDDLSNLYCDKDIDDKLKDIADNLDLKVRRCFLRDNRLTSLKDEPGAGNIESKDVVQDIIKNLNEMVNKEDLNDKFAEASVRLFGWIADKQEWDYLRQYPAVSQRANDGNSEVILLGQVNQDDAEIPLAPVQAWPQELQQFAELFPPSYVLADEFYEIVSDMEVWPTLTDKHILRTNAIITSNAIVNFESFLPNEPLNEDVAHRTIQPVTVSNVVFLQKEDVGIMERIRRSQRRARLFWRFVTEWLPIQDPKGLEVKEGSCGCGETHLYYQAAWLTPLANNKWVPMGNNSSAQATAQSLASLLRENGTLSISDSATVNSLLEAIGVTPLDLMRYAAPDDASRAALDIELTNIVNVSGSNPDRLRHATTFLASLEHHPDLIDDLDKRLKIRETVHNNQELGKSVEELVKETLKSEGFTVKPTGRGSDLEISAEVGDVVGLQVDKAGKKWLIEVKATRSRDARMTPVQAQKAVDEDDGFLLCVVPVETDGNPDMDDVRANMRFVEGIGNRVWKLCSELDDLEIKRSEINREYSDGVQLVVMSGTTRVSIDESVWKNDGFHLSELPSRLK